MIETIVSISSFFINSSGTALTVNLDDTTTINSVYIFKPETYKDYEKAINLTPLYEGTSVSQLDIKLSEIGEPYFDGVYIIEIENSLGSDKAITYDLTRYNECILNKVLEFSICDDCLKKNSQSLINANMLIEALKISVDNGFLEEVVNITKALKTYCSNKCKTCGEHKHINESQITIPTGNVCPDEPTDPTDPGQELNNIGTIKVVREDGNLFTLKDVYIFDVFTEETFYSFNFSLEGSVTNKTFTFGPVDSLQSYGVQMYYDIDGTDYNTVFTFNASSWNVTPIPYQLMSIETPEVVIPYVDTYITAAYTNNVFEPLSIVFSDNINGELYRNDDLNHYNEERYNANFSIQQPTTDTDITISFLVNNRIYEEVYTIPYNTIINANSLNPIDLQLGKYFKVAVGEPDARVELNIGVNLVDIYYSDTDEYIYPPKREGETYSIYLPATNARGVETLPIGYNNDVFVIPTTSAQ